VSSRGGGVLNQGLTILSGSKSGSRVWFYGRKGDPSEYFGGKLTREKMYGMEFNCIFLLMDVKLSDIYQQQQPMLEEKCKQWELSTEGSVQEFREHLTSYIRSSMNGGMDTKAASFRGDSNEDGGTFSESPQGLRDNEDWSALSDLMQAVQEEPKASFLWISLQYMS
jgi:hypothetical protein